MQQKDFCIKSVQHPHHIRHHRAMHNVYIGKYYSPVVKDPLKMLQGNLVATGESQERNCPIYTLCIVDDMHCKDCISSSFKIDMCICPNPLLFLQLRLRCDGNFYFQGSAANF